ncbi:MAG: pentapeptide repeat-containing protein [Magnetococcales bacterium]|nr:pentapeptide repeat-containing protein [Magnetococcales bacterium]
MNNTMKGNIWPGPKPYDENDWEFFSGRETEIHYACDRIKNYRLTVLSGGSGSGKTSLLRAGVVAELRNSRYSMDREKFPESFDSVVLMLRDWSIKEGIGFLELCQLKIRQSFAAIRSWKSCGGNEPSPRAVREAEILEKTFKQHLKIRNEHACADPIGEVIDWFSHLGYELQKSAALEPESISNVNGFVLIFDQFEELIRSEKNLSSDIIKLVWRIAESDLPIHVLLSLREEHISDLRDLDQAVNGLISKTYFLKPMELKAAMDVIRTVTRENREMCVNIDDDSLGRIESWLATPERRGASIDPSRKAEKVELIKLQAVLRELFDHVIKNITKQDNGQRRKEFKITIKDLDAFEEALAKEERRGSPQGVVQNALQRWISKSVDVSYSTEGGVPSIAELHRAFEAQDDRLNALVKRIAVRIAPHLSSGDYKVPQESSSLFRKALGDDVLSLINGSPTEKERITLISGAGDYLVLNHDSILQEDTLSEKWQSVSTQSGLAKEKKWTARQAAEYLVLAFHETLGRMRQSNILKSSGSSWELVHDQMGPTLTKWAENHRNTWEDSVASIALVSGITPLVIKEETVGEITAAGSCFSHLRWYGCNVRSNSAKRVKFYNVTFTWCNLNGTIFDFCDFYGCTFVDCTLHGVIFRGCSFRAIEETGIKKTTRFMMPSREILSNNAMSFLECSFKGVDFIDCRYNQLVISSPRVDAEGKAVPNILDTVNFKDCEIKQLFLADCKLNGPVSFNGSTILQGYFAGCEQGGELWDSASINIGVDSNAYFCSGEMDSWNLIRPKKISSLVSCSVDTTVQQEVQPK